MHTLTHTHTHVHIPISARLAWRNWSHRMMYVYVYTRRFICIHVCVCAYMYIATYVWTHMKMYIYVCVHICMYTYRYSHPPTHTYIYLFRQNSRDELETAAYATGWRTGIGCLKVQVSFRKRAAKNRAFVQKISFNDKASYASSPPVYMCVHTYVCAHIGVYTYDCVCVCVCVCVCISIDWHTYTHAWHTHTHTHSLSHTSIHPFQQDSCDELAATNLLKWNELYMCVYT